jgi:hypothetical protein
VSKVVQLKGEIIQRVTVEVDKNGTVWTEALDFGEVAGRSVVMWATPRPMDSRVMVMLLFRVVHDYTSKIFEQIGSVVSGKKSNHGSDI